MAHDDIQLPAGAKLVVEQLETTVHLTMDCKDVRTATRVYRMITEELSAGKFRLGLMIGSADVVKPA